MNKNGNRVSRVTKEELEGLIVLSLGQVDETHLQRNHDVFQQLHHIGEAVVCFVGSE